MCLNSFVRTISYDMNSNFLLISPATKLVTELEMIHRLPYIATIHTAHMLCVFVQTPLVWPIILNNDFPCSCNEAPQEVSHLRSAGEWGHCRSSGLQVCGSLGKNLHKSWPWLITGLFVHHVLFSFLVYKWDFCRLDSMSQCLLEAQHVPKMISHAHIISWYGIHNCWVNECSVV